MVLHDWFDYGPKNIALFNKDCFPNYEDIFTAISSLNERGTTIDIVTVGNAINDYSRVTELTTQDNSISVISATQIILSSYVHRRKEYLREREDQGEISPNEYAEKVTELIAKFSVSSWRRRQVTDELLDTPEPPALILRGESEILCRGQLLKISGVAGNKKSFLALTLAGCAINRGTKIDKTLGFISHDEHLKVLYIDTELPSRTYKGRLKAFKRITESNKLPDNFIYLALSGLSVDAKKDDINNAVRDIKPDIIIIDSVRDIVEDFNDNKEATRIKDYLKALATNNNAGVIVTIHQNQKQNEGGTSDKGHLGKTIVDFCDLGISLSKDEIEEDVTKVSFDKIRNDKPKEFSFKYDTNLHYLSLYEPLTDNSKKREERNKAKGLFEDIFREKKELRHGQILSALKERGIDNNKGKAWLGGTNKDNRYSNYLGTLVKKNSNGTYSLIPEYQEDNEDLPLF